MLIDDFLPNAHASEQHVLTVRASPERVALALRTTDFARSPLIRALLTLRAIPALFAAAPRRGALRPPSSERGQSTPDARQRRRLTLDSALDYGFILLGEIPEREVLLGLVGRFWRASGDVVRTDPDAFRTWRVPGYALAVWNFTIEPLGRDETRLATETRVWCTDDASRRQFRIYWSIVRPFSGLIRRAMLTAVRDAAQRSGPDGRGAA